MTSKTKRIKLLYGIGVNDSDYNVYKTDVVNGKQKVVWMCPYYCTWKSMLTRCYSNRFKALSPTYLMCTCVSDWNILSNFKAWMEIQDWQGKELDKDLLIKGNKVYGPETCIFIDSKVNKFILDSHNSRGDFPIGVNFQINDKGHSGYVAKCSSVVTGKQEYLGQFKTPEEAYAAWLKFKTEQARILIREQNDPRVIQALSIRYPIQ